ALINPGHGYTCTQRDFIRSHPPHCADERNYTLKRARRHGVASTDFALLEPLHEPVLALLRCTVGKRVRHDVTLRLLLQAVVADCGSGLQRLVDVAGIQEVMLLLRPVRPYAGKAI